MCLHGVGFRERGISPDSIEQFLPRYLPGATPAKVEQHLRFHGCKTMLRSRRTSDGSLAVVEHRAADPVAPEPVPAFQDGCLDAGRKFAGANRKFDCVAVRARGSSPDAKDRKRRSGMLSVSVGVDQRRVQRRAFRHGIRSTTTVHGRETGRGIQLLNQGFAKNAIGERDPYTTSCGHTQSVATCRGRVNGLRLPD